MMIDQVSPSLKAPHAHSPNVTDYFIECETRSVTPTSELADKQVDIDQEFAKQIVVTRTKTKTQKIAQKRA